MSRLSTLIKRFLMNLPRPGRAANLRRLKEQNEDLSTFILREAVEADIPALAVLHAKTWAETYWTVKQPPTSEIREWQWKEQFKQNDGSWFCFVMENNKKQLVGFAKGKIFSNEDHPAPTGDVNKIYLLRQYQRLGLGKRLLCTVARKFLSKGIESMILLGTPENPSGRFHEALGAEKLYSKEGEFHGGYCWKDLKKLTSICE